MTLAPDAAPRASATVGLARAMARAAAARGADPLPHIEAVGISRAVWDDVELRVGHAQLMELVERLAAATGDPLFGIRTAQGFVSASTLGAVGYAARSASTLREAIERVVRYVAVINQTTTMGVSYQERGALVTDGPRPPHVWGRHYAEQAIASFYFLSQKWIGRTYRPLDVGFAHPRPPEAEQIEAAFGCEVTFQCATNHILIPNEVLDAPILGADADLARVLERHVEGAARALQAADDPPRDTLAERLVREVTPLLVGGGPTLAQLAKRIAMSERTLQRRLGEAGTSFREVVDRARRSVGVTAVRSGMSVMEAAHLTGFNDPKAFRTAFKRWTGSPPGRFHRR